MCVLLVTPSFTAVVKEVGAFHIKPANTSTIQHSVPICNKNMVLLANEAETCIRYIDAF